ncbi:MAG: methylated-DNA--[protein]-cysteine S-methyltransferase [Prolixibacteraceae bacterium]
MPVTETHTYFSPIGPLLIEVFDNQIIKVLFSDTEVKTKGFNTELREKLNYQLDEYFAGRLFDFDLPVHPAGTDFQKRVWNQLLSIPYGKQLTYLELAFQLGNRNLLRAVGGANSRNPVAIIVPCHRVIGTNQKLVGYAGGIWRKKWLLQHENTHDPFRTTLL